MRKEGRSFKQGRERREREERKKSGIVSMGAKKKRKQVTRWGNGEGKR
jgi:hypothetical protein